jgi:hypothetical protein
VLLKAAPELHAAAVLASDFFHFAPIFLFFPLLSHPLFDILIFTIKKWLISVYPLREKARRSAGFCSAAV